MLQRPLLLEIVCKKNLINCDTSYGCLHLLSVKNFKSSFYIRYTFYNQYSWIALIPSSSTRSQSMPICLRSQNSVFPPTNQPRFLLSTPPRYVVPSPFIRLVALLGAKFRLVVVKRLPWIREITLGSQTLAAASFLPACTRPGRVTLKSTIIGTRWSIRLLPERSRLMSNCSVRTPRESVLLKLSYSNFFVADEKGMFKDLFAPLWDYFEFAKRLEARFVDIVAC